MDVKLNAVISLMMKYQKINNIKKECITNTQYLYDCINANFSKQKAKAKAVICIGNDCETNDTKVVVHMVVMMDNVIYDPSYEIYSLNGVNYFDNIKTVISSFSLSKTPVPKDSLRGFIDFIKLADKINNGEMLVCDRQFYNRQADYIEQNCM